jgi:hypothetical protein
MFYVAGTSQLNESSFSIEGSVGFTADRAIGFTIAMNRLVYGAELWCAGVARSRSGKVSARSAQAGQVAHAPQGDYAREVALI